MLRVLAGSAVEYDWIPVVLCVAALLVGAMIVLNRRRNADGRVLSLTLNNMTQGVVMYYAGGRLVVSNDRYRQMYQLPPEILKPGAQLVDIVRHRFKLGNLQRDPVQYCAELLGNMAAGKVVSFVIETPDGRAISVVNRAIPGGQYWVGTHDDITERRSAEQKSALVERAGSAPRGGR